MRLKRYLAAALAAGAALAAAGDLRADDVMARIHFAGTAWLDADKGAQALNEIRALPESGALREEVIQKLATTPFRVMNRNSPARKNDHAVELKPLVEDIFNSESYLEVRGPTNMWPEVALAVKVDKAHAEVWRATLASVLTDWTGIKAEPVQVEKFKGWELKKHHNPNVFGFFHADNWVVFGWGEGELRLVPAFLKEIAEKKRPVAQLKASCLDAWIDWPAFIAYHPLSFPLPKMELSVETRKEFLRPELKMQFAEPLGLQLEPWRIPTNFVGDGLASMTMARGFAPLLRRIPAISKLNAEPLPNQAMMWALPQLPFITCAAVPVNDSKNYLMRIAPGLISLINDDFTARNIAGRALLTTNMTVAIRGLAVLAPFLKATNDANGDYLEGTIFALPAAMNPFPWKGLFATISPDNVVYYDRESNSERLFQWHALSQLYYMNAARTLPRIDTPGQNWLTAIKPKLQECKTLGTLTAPNELTAVRNASIGLTGFELTCLAYWLDSPGFPLEVQVESVVPINAKTITPVPR